MRATAASWRPNDLLREPPNSILLIMLSAIGDAVLVLPVASALRRAFPSTHITWVLQSGPHPLVKDHPAVDEFVVFERGARSRNLRSVSAGVRAMASSAGALGEVAESRPGGRFDIALALQVYLKAGLFTAMAPARVKLGFDRRRARDMNWLFTTHQIPPHPMGFGHIQDQYFEFLIHLGVDPEPVEYGLELSGEERASQRDFFSSLNAPACALVVGSSDPRKNWTTDGYAKVAASLGGDFGLTPILVGGRTTREERMARAMLERFPGGEVVDARGGGLRRLLWLLAGSTLVISPDTGPLHMARAVDTPVVGLFGYTNPKRSGPYRRFEELVVDGYARVRGEDYGVSMKKRTGGMGRITPRMILEKVELALARYGR